MYFFMRAIKLFYLIFAHTDNYFEDKLQHPTARKASLFDQKQFGITSSENIGELKFDHFISRKTTKLIIYRERNHV